MKNALAYARVSTKEQTEKGLCAREEPLFSQFQSD